MKTLCMLVLMAVALGGHSSVLAAGQNGLLAKFKQSRSLSEGVASLKRAVFRLSADGASGKLGKITAAAFGLGMLLNVAATPAEAVTCLGCEQPPAPENSITADEVDFRISPLWHANGGFPDDGAAATLFSDHHVIVPNEWIKYFHIVINYPGDTTGQTTTFTLDLPTGWGVATDDIDGDGFSNAIAWYYNNGWQRITDWDSILEANNGISFPVDAAWFDMPGGGSTDVWDGVQFSIQLTGGATYVFEGKSQNEQIDAGIRPTFGGDDDSGVRIVASKMSTVGPGQTSEEGVTHYVHFHFRGFLPGDVDIDGFYSWRDLQYLQWRVWWGWNHINEGPNGGKDNYLWDVNEDGAINHDDISKLQEIMASGPWQGAAPSLLPARGGIAFSPPPGADYSVNENHQGTSINPAARSAVRPDGKAATTWGALKRQ